MGGPEPCSRAGLCLLLASGPAPALRQLQTLLCGTCGQPQTLLCGTFDGGCAVLPDPLHG